MSKNFKPIVRDRSVITGGKKLEHLVTYRHYPVFIASTDQPKQRDLFADMSFSICKESGVIQLDNLIPPAILYAGYHSEALGALWAEHHQGFTAFFKKFSPKNILEIGGSNAFMAEEYLRHKPNANWTIVEPNPTKPSNPHIKIIPKFFDETLEIKRRVDAIIHSHTLEHMYDPDAFLRDINELLPEGGLNIFSVPNLYQYLKHGYSNCINFEHTIFLTEYFVDYLLAKNGFEITKKYYFHEHSIFYATRKASKKLDAKPVSHYEEYKKMFRKYAQDNATIVVGINKKMLKAPGNVYLFGAHVFSQMLINIGLKTKKIKFILDNSKLKQAKRLYGTDLIVQPPEFIKGEKQPTIILRVGAYRKEIGDQIRKINKTAIFIE